MDVAAPARRVSPATAEMAADAEAVRVDAATPVMAPIVAPAPAVEAADNHQVYIPKDDDDKMHDASNLSLKNLRNIVNIGFESYAAVVEAQPKRSLAAKMLPWVFGERPFLAFGEAKKYIALAEGSCFVYVDKEDPSPLYVIPIEETTVGIEDPRHPHSRSVTISPWVNNITQDHFVTALLIGPKGKLRYQFTFSTEKDATVVERFVAAFRQSAGANKPPRFALAK